ncbi:MAG: hypothetical protein JWN76_3271 [Chitinophagaceae bacterium]|nr:hypothetical protein [Chitinophagaceae bacterium]
MSEEQNIPEEKSEDQNLKPKEVNANTSKDEIIQPPTATEKQPPNMEVHKHPHNVTHKKKWSEYLLEFFMLFLAVFLGFIAENIREGVVENHREKQFMQSLVKDLQLDTAYANQCLLSISKRDMSIDSTLNYFINHSTVSKVPLSTARQMRRSTWDQVFLEHTGTFDQLRYSGGLRLIHKRNIVDSIDRYYQQMARFALSRQSYGSNQDLVWSLQEKVLDAFDNIKIRYQHLNLSDSATMTIHPGYLNEYLNLLLRLKNSANNDKNFNNAIKARANNLIDLIKKEYHLE